MPTYKPSNKAQTRQIHRHLYENSIWAAANSVIQLYSKYLLGSCIAEKIKNACIFVPMSPNVSHFQFLVCHKLLRLSSDSAANVIHVARTYSLQRENDSRGIDQGQGFLRQYCVINNGWDTFPFTVLMQSGLKSNTINHAQKYRVVNSIKPASALASSITHISKSGCQEP